MKNVRQRWIYCDGGCGEWFHWAKFSFLGCYLYKDYCPAVPEAWIRKKGNSKVWWQFMHWRDGLCVNWLITRHNKVNAQDCSAEGSDWKEASLRNVERQDSAKGSEWEEMPWNSDRRDATRQKTNGRRRLGGGFLEERSGRSSHKGQRMEGGNLEDLSTTRQHGPGIGFWEKNGNIHSHPTFWWTFSSMSSTCCWDSLHN